MEEQLQTRPLPNYGDMVEVWLGRKDSEDGMSRVLAAIAFEDLQEYYMDRLVDEYPEELL